jgi:APA family basic amino acid/polyamine antiporter
VAILAILPGQADFLGSIYAFGAMLSFSMAHLAVIRLRAIAPDQERPYRSPGRLRVRGHDFPLFAVLGLMGTGSAFLVVTVLDLTVGIAGTIWLALGMVVYIVYRRRQGLDLTTTHKVVEAKLVTEREAEYESVLVAFETRDYDPQTVATAIRLAARRRRGIHVLALVTVPASSPLDAALPEAELAARSLIEQARVQGGRRVTGRVEKVRAGQAGRLIVQEARTLRARALILPLPQRGGGSIFSKTVETVLSDRPCRVILEADPRPDDRRGVVTTAG